MTSRSTLLTAVTASVGLAIAVAATTANGEPALERAVALSAAAARSPALARAQLPSDVFRSRSSHPANQAAAADIARTSRRAFSDDRGEAFVFLNNDDELCLEWRRRTVEVAGSSCTPVDSPHLPGVLMGTGATMDEPILASMVEPGVGHVVVEQADGSTIDVAVRDGVFVHQGRTPFVLHWQGAGGEEHSRRVTAVDPPA